jgi:hypothetical protein
MEKDIDDNNTNINKHQNDKGKKVKGRWVLCFFVFLLFYVLFCGGSFIFMLSSSLENFLFLRI